LVLVVSPARLSAGWLAYWPVCYQLRSLSARANRRDILIVSDPRGRAKLTHNVNADTVRTRRFLETWDFI
jgi:hypothetical protein